MGGGGPLARLARRCTMAPVGLFLVCSVVPAASSARPRPVRHDVPITWPSPSPQVSGPGSGPVSKSTNWSGYATVGQKGDFTEVSAQWREPSLTCTPSLLPKNDDSFWIGIDGFSDSTVEQTGTEGICHQNKTTYDAWYELYPKPSVEVFTISAGDKMSADVTFLGGKQYSVTVSDLTSGHKFHRTFSVPQAERASAEWIAETSAECTNCLEDFGTVRFTQATAQKDGATGGIGNFPYKEIVMITPGKAKTVVAQPSPIGSTGKSFSVIWKGT